MDETSFNYNPVTGLPIKGGGIQMGAYGVPQSVNVGKGTYYMPNMSGGYQYPSSGQQFTYDTPNDSGNWSSAPQFQVDTPNYSGGGYSQMPKSSMGLPNLPYGSAILGAVQLPFAIQAMRQANKAKLPQFQQNPYLAKSMAEADSMRNQGFSGSERTAYEQGLGNQSQSTYQQAVRLSGGQLSGAINSILKGQNTDSRNQLAVADAGLRRQSMNRADNMAGQVQSIDNMNTQLGVDNYNRKQQAAAQLMQSSLGNLANPLNYLGGIL